MTDNEIIKALECCSNAKNEGDCVILGCPYYLEEQCTKKNGNDALDLINRQKAEIERLKELLTEWKTEAYKVADEKDELYCNAVERVKTAKAEAIKEFAERLYKKAERYGKSDYYFVLADDIVDLVKEMVGDV